MATSPKPCPACRGSRYVWAVPVSELTPGSCGYQRARCPSCDGQGQIEGEPVAEGFPLELPPCEDLIAGPGPGFVGTVIGCYGEIDAADATLIEVAEIPGRIRTLELGGGVF